MIIEKVKPSGRIVVQKSYNYVPKIRTIQTATQTTAQLLDQGYTYNEPGLTYNQIGVFYAGAYGEADFIPIVSMAQGVHPTIMRSEMTANIGTTPVGDNSGMLIGMMGMTYP